MPGFRQELSDTQLTALIEYIRTLRTNAPGWPELVKDVAKIRAKTVPQP